MHVAIVCPYSLSAFGGVQQHARGLSRALVERGHDVTLFGPELRGPQPDLTGVGTISLGGKVNLPANGSIAPLGIDPRMLVRFDLGLDPADVVHLHEPFLPASLGALMRRPRRTAVVGTFHAAASEGFWPYAVAAPLLRRASRRLDATTAVSPAARSLVRRYVPVEPDIVPNGVDVASFRDAEPDRWAAELDGKVVLLLGRPERRKGFDVVVRAFAAAATGDAHLVTTAEPHDLPPDVPRERIHCLGRVSDERRNALYRAADVACFAALGGESFGVVLLEGMAAGCAVIASDIEGYRYAGGDAAGYVAPGDVSAWARALERVLDDTDERSRLASAGSQRAELFDWSRVAEHTLEVYERVV